MFGPASSGASHNDKSLGPAKANHIVKGFWPLGIVLHTFARNDTIKQFLAVILIARANNINARPFPHVNSNVFLGRIKEAPDSAIDIQAAHFQDASSIEKGRIAFLDIGNEIKLGLVGHGGISIAASV